MRQVFNILYMGSKYRWHVCRLAGMLLSFFRSFYSIVFYRSTLVIPGHHLRLPAHRILITSSHTRTSFSDAALNW